uniref:Ig-like domain-containing protein n=1 Tax=Astatotilapia calliptera TaxID=8154 RepID=A0A3P8PSB7_ASTCA
GTKKVLAHRLLYVFVSVSSESRGQITVTHPGVVSSAVGGTVNIKCTTSQDVYSNDRLAWYQQKDGGVPKRLIYGARTRQSGISDRFTGIQAEDAAVYYCQSYHIINSQSVQGFSAEHKRTIRSPSIPPPTRKNELKQGKATVMCVANKGFPSDWSLSWKVDGSGSISWEESRSPVVQENDGLYSWSSTLRLPADHWMKVGSVTCEATQGSHTVVSEPLMRDQCPQS